MSEQNIDTFTTDERASAANWATNCATTHHRALVWTPFWLA